MTFDERPSDLSRRYRGFAQHRPGVDAKLAGQGCGAGVAVDPVGYLEIGQEGATFRSIREPYPSPLFLLASRMTTAIVLRSLARVIRG